MPFRKNDYVKTIEGFIPPELGYAVNGWQGRIKELPNESSEFILVELDAQTLDSLPEEYLAWCIENGGEFPEYYFSEEELLPATRRDTDALLEAAINRTENRIEEIDPEYYENFGDEFDLEAFNKLLNAFVGSPEFNTMLPERQYITPYVLHSFSKYAFAFYDCQPGKWRMGELEEVCLEILPRKVIEEPEFFQLFGYVLADFFVFSKRAKLTEDAETLHEIALEIAPKIPQRANTPGLWSPGKVLAMKAMQSEIDSTNEVKRSHFILVYNAGLLGQKFPLPPPAARQKPLERPVNVPPSAPPKTISNDPFRHISRSEYVQVKYQNGAVKKGKFKHLENDLRAGRCKLLK